MRLASGDCPIVHPFFAFVQKFREFFHELEKSGVGGQPLALGRLVAWSVQDTGFGLPPVALGRAPCVADGDAYLLSNAARQCTRDSRPKGTSDVRPKGTRSTAWLLGQQRDLTGLRGQTSPF